MKAKQPNLENISVIIPAYNEGLGIGKVLKTLENNERLSNSQIIVIDDGSTDGTAEVVRGFSKVQLLQHHWNMGYGSAISSGIRAADREYILWFDSDGQHRVEDLLSVADNLIEADADFCIGYRDHRSTSVKRRIFGKFILRQLVQLAVGRQVKDFNSGLRGFKRSVIKKYRSLLPKGFGASTATTLLMLEGKYLGLEVPIIVLERSGQSSVNQLRDGLRTLIVILRIILLYKPLRFFLGIGTVLIVLGLVYGFVRAFLVGLGFPVLASLVIMLGVQAVFFGLLADQINSLRFERFE